MGPATPYCKKTKKATETATIDFSNPPPEEEEGHPGKGVYMKREPTHLLSPRETSRVGTWNVRTMSEVGKVYQIAKELRTYTLTLLGLCETRWTGAGQTKLGTGEMILYSGHEDSNAPHTEGVALMLGKQAQKALIAWEALGPRLIQATFKTTNAKIKLNVIQCYAPTIDKEEQTKEEFYNLLQKTIDKIKGRGITILMGDLNAKIGEDNRGYEGTIGKHGLGVMNENGEMLANLCATNQLVIGGSLFSHKRIHKATWISPDHRKENQINHVCINKKFRSSLHDVKVQRGADVGSDHHLLVATLKMKLKRHPVKGDRRTRYNVNHLQDQEKKKNFCISLSNRFSLLEQLEEENVENHWLHVKEALTHTCETVLGKKEYQHKKWISAESLKKIHERRAKKWTSVIAKQEQRRQEPRKNILL